MISIFSVPEAKNNILRRQSFDDIQIPASMQNRIDELFGTRLSPDQAVQRILAEIRTDGDLALSKWTTLLDGSTPSRFLVPPEEIQSALVNLPQPTREALESSISRVREFHAHQPLTSWITNEMGGTLGQLVRPIQRVGLYIPAGSAPLPSSVIMSAVPAQVARVPEIVIVSPPNRKTGRIDPSILAVAAMLNLEEVYMMGGAQAIGALAYGTASIQAVDKIFGPGNLFVTIAKKQVFGTVGIDNLAGPTETMIIADDSANPAWVAADLLAQAEHDVIASAILLTPSRDLALRVADEIKSQVEGCSRKDIISASLETRSGIVVTNGLNQAIDLANQYGAEHLCLAVQDPWSWVEKITCAGGIFLGDHSFEVLGDYIAGPSHVMPTGGSARFASPLNVWDFVRLISLIGLDRETARRISSSAQQIALSEGLDAHANAARVRK